MLKEIRESKGITRQQLANISGINGRIIEAYEQGRRSIDGASLKTLLILANALEVPLINLLDGKEVKGLLEKNSKYQ